MTDLAERLPHVVNYNVAVDDSGEQVVFLRRIIPKGGPLLRRARGAAVGLPLQAVNWAEEILEDGVQRRGRSQAPLRSRPPSAGPKRAGVQVSLSPKTIPRWEALRTMDVNGLTPLDALNKLYGVAEDDRLTNRAQDDAHRKKQSRATDGHR
ncbi:MAG: hypothetical protein R2838_22870 [Caldilineaceae bacterium]